jgi:hypothetical protein
LQEGLFLNTIVLLNKNIKIILNYFLGPLVFLFLFYTIWHQLLRQQNWLQSFRQIRSAFNGPGRWMIWTAILLMPVNWGLEARKWQLAVHRLQPISFIKAFGAVLTGTTIACFTPNRMGEYLGRMLYMDKGKRIPSISLSLLCSMAQLLVTLMAGYAGIFYLQWHLHTHLVHAWEAIRFLLKALLVGIPFAGLILTILYFRLPSLVRWIEKKYSGKYLLIVKVFEETRATILFRILLLCFIRYAVFIMQYYLLFQVFGVTLTWGQTFGGVSVMFLVMAVVPTFTFLTDLGLRWEASIQIIELFSPNTSGIFAVALGIWLINLIIPALIGSLLILGIKLFKNR